MFIQKYVHFKIFVFKNSFILKIFLLLKYFLNINIKYINIFKY